MNLIMNCIKRMLITRQHIIPIINVKHSIRSSNSSSNNGADDRKTAQNHFREIGLKTMNQFNSKKVKNVKARNIKVTFILDGGERLMGMGRQGDTLLEVVNDNNLEIDGYGACEGTLSCSTCHVMLKEEDYRNLPEGASDEELDILELAYDLCDTSRLGCQIKLTKEMDGIEVIVPASVNDARLI
ncbi:hypothetical protein RDWZM_010021 [Blomia tropicalis]|uniref:2Fe-2S ferredoxin-type domain-containing protein n=1 Tax=Blomia tropicalis TaxID=40697 RepID=A0A9Q0LYJ5_BLOTA|nr:hypothetical protein RDWZM_010021 [Blomia tropicalis]